MLDDSDFLFKSVGKVKGKENRVHRLPINMQATIDAGKVLERYEEHTVKGFTCFDDDEIACFDDESKKEPQDHTPEKFVGIHTVDDGKVLERDEEHTVIGTTRSHPRKIYWNPRGSSFSSTVTGRGRRYYQKEEINC